MTNLVLLGLAGFVAQLIDGSLGMGYGVTSSTMLLTMGMTPALVSASVHAGEVVTTLVSGASHWYFGNVDRRMMWRLALPGSVGAFLGALFLSSIPVHVARPVVSMVLFLLGVVVVVRLVSKRRPAVHQAAASSPSPRARTGASDRFLTPLGFVAGLLDATGGGGWGPVATSTLVARRHSDARRVIGTVDASEFLVALSATIGFVIALGWDGVNLTWVIAIMVGGVFAAPLAAWIVRKISANILGISVATMILVSNARIILIELGVDVPATALLAVLLVLAVSALAGWRLRHNPAPESVPR